MTIDLGPIQTRAAQEIAVGGLRVWYHLPFALLDDGIDPARHGWVAEKPKGTLQQQFYFHPFVSNALWDRADGGVSALFDLYRKPAFEFRHFTADFDSTDWKEMQDGKSEQLLCRRTFRGTVRTVELRRLREPAGSGRQSGLHGFAMLVVSVDFLCAAYGEYPRDKVKDPAPFAPLTLADAQDALDLSRRIFPRWHFYGEDALPGDALTRVPCFGPAPSRPEMDEGVRKGKTQLMPWVRELVAPFTLSEPDSRHFGDERAFITSAVLLGDGSEQEAEAFTLMTRVKDSDLMRLAEVDRRGTGYSYNKPFLDALAPGYFYTRQAPDGPTGTGNSTLYITASHHFCALGAGGYMRNVILGNGIPGHHDMGHAEEYYRHMQFLCVFEFFRLLQFSQTLSELVRSQRERGAIGDKSRTAVADSGQRLMRIRDEFLDFTHLHHFSNISSQLQPREMYDRLYAAFGIPAMFAEVEKELEAATSVHEMHTNAEAREDAARLNKLVSVGVPLSLLVGAGGMNIFIGDKAPFGLHAIVPALPGQTDAAGPPDGWLQLLQLSVLVAIIAGIWALAERVYFRDKRSFWGWLAYGAAAAAFAGSEALHLWPAP